jgi:hypothetical protein
VVTLDGQKLSWKAIPGASQYLVLRNGKTMKAVAATKFQLPASDLAEYQVLSIDKTGTLSFASEPIIPAHPSIITLQFESVVSKSNKPYKGFAGDGFVMINTTQNMQLNFTITVPDDGNYATDFRYANGNGPVNTENKCAIRSLFVNDEFVETVVFPQRGTGEWSEWGYSNSVILKLKSGANRFSLRYEPYNENMNGTVNEAAIDFVRVVNLK